MEACRTLNEADRVALVAHARASGLVQKRSTPIAFTLMRVATGRALSASTVSRASRLIQHVIDTSEDLDTALPEWALF